MAQLLANPPLRPFPTQKARLWDAPSLLRYWHLTSLDAPTVAIVWAWSLAWATGAHVPAWSFCLLGCVVWSVYIGDRLLDVRAARHNGEAHPLQDRHFFHWRHRRVLIPLACATAAAALWLVLTRVPLRALKPDSLVAVATLFYFSGVHCGRRLPRLLARVVATLESREFLVGVLFAAGCVLPAWSHAAHGAATLRALAGPTILFAALAWLNVRGIGMWESGDVPHRVTERVLFAGSVMALGALFLAATLGLVEPRTAALLICVATSALLLALLDLCQSRLTRLALRTGADAVLLTPLLLAITCLRHG